MTKDELAHELSQIADDLEDAWPEAAPMYCISRIRDLSESLRPALDAEKKE